MATAKEWVRQTLEKSQASPLATEDVLKSLERFIGQGDRALEKARTVLEYIDGELVDRRGGLAMRDLWHAVADYIEKVQEARAAA